MKLPVSNERFSRYQRAIYLALRLVLHKARAQVVSEWSGLSQDQVTALRKRWLPDIKERFRGQSPTSFQPFFRSATRGGEAALFVSIFLLVGLHSTTPCLDGGEQLCEAFEIFRAWEPDSTLEFDYALLLAMGALEKNEVLLSRCGKCSAVVLIDKMGRTRSACEHCRKKSAEKHNYV